MNTFDELKDRARRALHEAKTFYSDLNEAQWPDEYLSIKSAIGVWQLPWIDETLKEVDRCQLERELFVISSQISQYQRDLFRVWHEIKPLFEYSEEDGIYVPRQEFEWVPFPLNREETSNSLMSVARDVSARVQTLLDTIEERREFKIRDIEAAAKRAGYRGTLRQLRQHLVNWRGIEREEAEWLLSGSQLDDFLNRHLLPRQRRRKV